MTERILGNGIPVKLSIITIHLDDFAGLGRTFASLRLLNDRDVFEWVVIDGGSTALDENRELFELVGEFSDCFVSEPDQGIYDAMNKGTRLAKGDYVLYLNAGDELYTHFDPGDLKELLGESRPEMIWGRCQERYKSGALVQVKTRSPAWTWYGMAAYHPAIFFRRDLLGQAPYDTAYKIAADYDLVCRLIGAGAQVIMLKAVVSIFHHGGLSDTQGDATREEENRIRLKYFNIPVFAGNLIKGIKGLNARISRVAWFRRLWRRWI